MLSMMLITALVNAEANALVDGPVETVAEGFQFTEGPVWTPAEGLLFSDIPADTIYRADESVFRRPSDKSNGLTLDREGRLIACEHWNRRVTRTEPDGSITVLADAYEGKKFNSPNDVVVRSDGSIFFTDPPYGLEGREAELDFSGVYIIRSEGEVELLTDAYSHPNGLAFSPDERMLYIGDSHHGFIDVYDVAEDGTLSNQRRFCDVPVPDGMKVDEDGRLWTTSSDGIQVFDPDGERVELIEFPHPPANCAFGDEDSKTLYVTARSGVYKVRTTVVGIRP